MTNERDANSGWEAWLPQFIRTQLQCRAIAILPADYQQIMLTAPFLTGSLRKDDAEYGHVLLIGLGARSIASFIHKHLFWVSKYCNNCYLNIYVIAKI